MRDDDGYFAICDRLKDMIITSGFNVYPAEVENVLYGHPAVGEAAVYGAPDTVRGEQVAASVVLRPGAAATAEELIEFCRARIAGYKSAAQRRDRDADPEEPDRQDPEARAARRQRIAGRRSRQQ